MLKIGSRSSFVPYGLEAKHSKRYNSHKKSTLIARLIREHLDRELYEVQQGLALDPATPRHLEEAD